MSFRVEYYTADGKACAVAGAVAGFLRNIICSVSRSIDLSQMASRVFH